VHAASSSPIGLLLLLLSLVLHHSCCCCWCCPGCQLDLHTTPRLACTHNTAAAAAAGAQLVLKYATGWLTGGSGAAAAARQARIMQADLMKMNITSAAD
jgi:hypothetical protein